MKKIAVFFSMIIVSFFIFSGCNKNKSEIKIVLDWTPNTNHTGLYVARELGYFDEEGLSIKIIEDLEVGSLSNVAANTAEFGISTQEEVGVALSNKNPLPVTAVSAILQHNYSGLLSLKSSNISSFKDLEGKKYASWDAPIEMATIKYSMEKQGAEFNKLNAIPATPTNILSALNTKDFDTIWIHYGWDGIASEVEGMETNYLKFIDVDQVFDFYTPLIIANNNLLKNEPEKVKKFLRAVSKGYEYCVENPQESAEILCKAVPEIKKELAIKSMEYLADNFISDAKQFGYIDKTRWETFFNWVDEYVDAVDITQSAMVGFDNSFLPEINNAI